MGTTTLEYIAGFLDGDGSIFFQIVKTNTSCNPFKIRGSVLFSQKRENASILEHLHQYFGVGYIRHRKTGVSDYTVVEPKEVERLLTLLRPYLILKKRHAQLGLDILQRLKEQRSFEDFLEICKLVDMFGTLNYSKKRTITSKTVEDFFQHNIVPL
jgi:hypothetical protein